MGMVGEACLPSNAYYPRTPDYTLCSGVHVCWSEHSDLSFVYGFMIFDYGFGTMTATTSSCCGYPLEAPRQGASNKYSKHRILWRNKKHNNNFDWKKYRILNYTLILCFVYAVHVWERVSNRKTVAKNLSVCLAVLQHIHHENIPI